MEEGSTKVEKERKKQKKGKGKEKNEGKGKDKGKSKRKSKEKEIKPDEIQSDSGKKHAPYAKEQCSLKANIIYQFPELHVPFNVFSDVTNLDGLVKLLVDENNLHTQQNGREFHTNKQEMRAFLGIIYIVSINKLPTIKSYWECGQFIGSESIRNVMSRSGFEDVLRNLHFSDNAKDDKSDK